MNIAVVMGGISTERNISIIGGKSVVDALRSLGHNVIPIDPAFGKDYQKAEDLIIDVSKPVSIEELSAFHPRSYLEMMELPLWNSIDIAFIVLHGKYGEDGLIQSLFEFKKIPYTGSNPKTCAVAMDKIFTKNMLTAYGILTPKWIPIDAQSIDNDDLIKEIRKELGNKIVVKPNDQGSSIGITIVKSGNLDDIYFALKEAAKYSDRILVEEFIDGREITCGLIEGEALPLIEIVPKDDFYNYTTKYIKGNSNYICPAELSENVTEFIRSVSEMCYNILGVNSFCRIDYRLTQENEPYFLELNPIPGFTSTSLVPMAAREIGIEFPELCERLAISAIKNSRK